MSEKIVLRPARYRIRAVKLFCIPLALILIHISTRRCTITSIKVEIETSRLTTHDGRLQRTVGHHCQPVRSIASLATEAMIFVYFIFLFHISNTYRSLMKEFFYTHFFFFFVTLDCRLSTKTNDTHEIRYVRLIHKAESVTQSRGPGLLCESAKVRVRSRLPLLRALEGSPRRCELRAPRPT